MDIVGISKSKIESPLQPITSKQYNTGTTLHKFNVDQTNTHSKVNRKGSSSSIFRNNNNYMCNKTSLKNTAFIIPELPTGQQLEFNILSTWGDPHYLGLMGSYSFIISWVDKC